MKMRSVEYTSEDENGVEVEEGELTPDSPCPCGSGKNIKLLWKSIRRLIMKK